MLSSIQHTAAVCLVGKPDLQAWQYSGEVAIDHEVLHRQVAHGMGALPLLGSLHHAQERLQIEGREAGHTDKAGRCLDTAA